MPDDQLTHPPDPSWRGFMAGHNEAFIEGMTRALDQTRTNRLESIRNKVARLQDRINEYAALMRQEREQKAQLEAERRQLEAVNPEIDGDAIQRDLDYIKGLPGVLGMRLERGEVVIHVRTSGVYDNKRYDMGDFEIRLGSYDPQYDRREVLQIFCTRAGTRSDTYGDRYSHPYFHGRVRRDGTAEGWFCFGNRADQIASLRDRGAYGEMMHLVINTMNSVTAGSEFYYRDCFTEIPFETNLKDTLKRRAYLRRSRPRRETPLP